MWLPRQGGQHRPGEGLMICRTRDFKQVYINKKMYNNLPLLPLRINSLPRLVYCSAHNWIQLHIHCLPGSNYDHSWGDFHKYCHIQTRIRHSGCNLVPERGHREHLFLLHTEMSFRTLNHCSHTHTYCSNSHSPKGGCIDLMD